jgi:hypothetical protein
MQNILTVSSKHILSEITNDYGDKIVSIAAFEGTERVYQSLFIRYASYLMNCHINLNHLRQYGLPEKKL